PGHVCCACADDHGITPVDVRCGFLRKSFELRPDFIHAAIVTRLPIVCQSRPSRHYSLGGVMALVTITGNAWDHNRAVVPSTLRPQLGFRPLKTSMAAGLMTDREVWASSFSASSGSFSVSLEQDVSYVPFMRW